MNKLTAISPYFSYLCLTLQRYQYNDDNHEIGVVNEYAGIAEFVDQTGMIRITRTNEFVRKYLTDLGYTFKEGGSVHQVDFRFVHYMLNNKLETMYANGLSRDDMLQELLKDHDLQLALAFAGDPTFQNEKMFSLGVNGMDSYSYYQLLEANSEYLHPHKYAYHKFTELVIPEVDHFLNLKNESLGAGRGNRGSR